jgi:hypothetical protein
MRPYLGIIIDSFWEAVSNRVLWALLLTSSLTLIALAPFGLVVQHSRDISSLDIIDRERFVRKLARGLDQRGSPGLKAIADSLSPEFAEKVRRESRENELLVGIAELVSELNRIARIPDLYSEERFPTADKRERLKGLIDGIPEGLSPEELQQLNRELLQIALAPELNASSAEQIWVGYAGYKLGTPLAVTRRQIELYMEPLILQLIVQYGLGVMIVFVAIVVTSPIIPETFRAGNLHLLLSKPISRTWLFLSKFAGGCIFVTLNLIYVLVGIYLIVGLQFGIWNTGLLGCIPLLLFVYLILYSVSALAGLIWGNAIVSVIATVLFWVFFFAVGTMHDVLHLRVEQWSQLRRIEQFGEEVLAVNEAGNLRAWDRTHAVWRPATAYSVQAQGLNSLTFGPFPDLQPRQFLVKTFMPRTFDSSLVRRSRSLTLVRLDDRLPPPESVKDARDSAVWNALPGPEIPEQVFRIDHLDGQLIVVSRLGLFRLDLEKSDWRRSGGQSWLGLFVRSPFEEVTPAGFRMSDNTTAIPFGDSGLLVYTDGLLTRMRLEKRRFEILKQTQLDGDGSEAALLAACGNYFLVARDRMPLQLFDADLQSIGRIELPGSEKPKQLSWIPGTELLMVLSHSGNLFQLDCKRATIQNYRLPFSTKVTCMNWSDPHRVWLGLSPNRAVCIDSTNNETVEILNPQPTRSEIFYHRVVRPLYRFNPKPAALNQSMRYVLTGETTADPQLITFRLDNAQVELDVWQPIISNLVFLVVMLAASCIYLSRKEY